MRLAPMVAPTALVLLTLPAVSGVRAQSPDAPGEGGPGLDGEYVQLVVGQRARLCPGGNCRAPICDDPATAVISGDGSGILEARAPGFTTCSVDYGLGQRRVLQVEVVARPGTSPARPGTPPPPPPAPSYPATPAAAPPPGTAARMSAPRSAATAGTSGVATPSAGTGAAAPVYRWTAPDGSVQFGYPEDVPPSQRDRATRVTAEISVVPTPEMPSVPPSRAPAPPPVERTRPSAEPPAEIDLPPPAEAAPPDTLEPGELQCWTAANGRMTCAPYGQRQPVRARPGPPAPGGATSPSR